LLACDSSFVSSLMLSKGPQVEAKVEPSDTGRC